MRSGSGRRDFLASLALGGGAPFATPSAGAERRATFAAVDDLGLDAGLRADLETFAQPVLQEAAWLEELPLDEIDPAFVFIPRG
jgi:hypothetical protein